MRRKIVLSPWLKFLCLTMLLILVSTFAGCIKIKVPIGSASPVAFSRTIQPSSDHQKIDVENIISIVIPGNFLKQGETLTVNTISQPKVNDFATKYVPLATYNINLSNIHEFKERPLLVSFKVDQRVKANNGMLVGMRWSDVLNKWIVLPSRVDGATKTITLLVNHLSDIQYGYFEDETIPTKVAGGTILLPSEYKQVSIKVETPNNESDVPGEGPIFPGEVLLHAQTSEIGQNAFYKWYVNGTPVSSGINQKDYVRVKMEKEEAVYSVRLEVYSRANGPLIAENFRTIKTWKAMLVIPRLYIKGQGRHACLYEDRGYGVAGEEITFTVNLVQCPKDQPITITWEFDDGSKAEGLTVKHAWKTRGSKSVRATASWAKPYGYPPATAGTSCSNIIYPYIEEVPTIQIISPIGAGNTGETGKEYVFEAKLLTSYRFYDSVIWSFSDGTKYYDLVQTPPHVFKTPGIYEITAYIQEKGNSCWIKAEATMKFPVAGKSASPAPTIPPASSHPVIEMITGPKSLAWNGPPAEFKLKIVGGTPPYNVEWRGNKVIFSGVGYDTVMISPSQMRDNGEGYWVFITVKDSAGKYAQWVNDNSVTKQEFTYGVTYKGIVVTEPAKFPYRQPGK